MTGKDELINKLYAVDLKIQTLQNEITTLKEERQEIQNEIRNFDMNEETKRVLDSIKTASSSNSIYKSLESDTKTTPIMEEFCKSLKPFLVFRNIFRVRLHRVSIVVIKSTDGINFHASDLTMTDLKKASRTCLFQDYLDFVSKSRLYPLYSELLQMGDDTSKPGDRIAFKKPCLLKGQTFDDQTGHGSEYYGETLVHPGKPYGDATRFLIIGAIIEGK